MQEAGLASRFEAMGLEARPSAGGQSVLVELPLGPEPFETLGGSRRVTTVRFVTVGADRIKCLAPRALFYLPLIRIRGCQTTQDLESRIREAWSESLGRLRRARDWLTRLGVACESPRATPQWVFSLGLEDKQTRASTIEPGRVILPSTGPLSGIPLERAEDRVFRPDPSCSSAVDLELAVTTHVEELARYAERTREWRRRSGSPTTPRALEALARKPLILLVGPRLGREMAFQDSLTLRGFEVGAARSIDEAIEGFARRSYELVLADTRLDRGDGIELIPALRRVAGLEEIPVVLLDHRPGEARRAAARSAGAAGYVARTVDPKRLCSALARLIQSPRRRRFTRYRRTLAVSWPGSAEPATTGNVCRAGMLLRTPRDLPGSGPIGFQIHLAEMTSSIEVEGRAVSRRREPGRLEIGVHFRRFREGSERTWIDFLRSLEPQSVV